MPPIARRMPGRPAKKMREPMEGKNKHSTKLSRAGRVFKCRVCLVEGHNRLTCPKRKEASVSYFTALCNFINTMLFLFVLIIPSYL